MKLGVKQKGFTIVELLVVIVVTQSLVKISLKAIQSPAFSEWELTGDVTYNSSSGEVEFSGYGNIMSPPIRVDGPESWVFNIEVNTPPRPGRGDSNFVYSVRYYDAGMSPYTVTGGYTDNGYANWVDSNTWAKAIWAYGSSHSGPGLTYIRLYVIVNSDYGMPSLSRHPKLTVSR